MIRIATWNTKQAVAPVLRPDAAWRWMEEHIDPDIVVLTEAKMPPAGVPTGWTANWEPDGFGNRRRWGTIVAATRGWSLRRVDTVHCDGEPYRLEPQWPAAAIVSDVFAGSERWATVVGLYGLTVDDEGKSVGHGGYSLVTLMEDLAPLLGSDRAERLIIGGDFNLVPEAVTDVFDYLELDDLVDLIAYTRGDRPERLVDCVGCDLGDECGHLWTHRNRGGKRPSVQQVDYLFASESLLDDLGRVYGGYAAFPTADEASDHAPVVAEFSR